MAALARRRPLLRLGATVLLATALSVLPASCGSAEFRYVRDSQAGTGFKVPSDWTVFDKNTFLGTSSGPTASTPDPIQWLVAVDGDPTPSPGHVFNQSQLATSHPEGFAMVFTLSSADRDRMSIAGIRNFLFPVDQLMNLGSDDATMKSYDDSVTTDEGLRGVRMVFEFRAAALDEVNQDPNASESTSSGSEAAVAFSNDFVVMDQVGYVDDATNKLYVMALMCSADCYDRYQREIANSIESWTVRP